MQYSNRTIGIVAILINQMDYITVSAISKTLDVSKRTVFRELDEVEAFLKGYGAKLITRTRFGIKIDAKLEQVQAIRSVIKANQGIDYSQKARLERIVVELLKNRAPNKLFYYANLLGVSEATISNDMDKLQPWFQAHKIELVRKPGFGVCLEGDEVHIRRAIVDYVYDHFEQSELVNLLNNKASSSSWMDSVMDKGILLKTGRVLSEFDEVLKHRLTENAFLGLTIHLAIAVQRVLRHEKIEMRSSLLNELKSDIQFEIARSIAERVAEAFDIEFPLDEIGYISMHLKGSKLKTGTLVQKEELILSNYDLTKLASKLIEGFENDQSQKVSTDEQLLVGLVAHLRPALTRLHLSLQIRNPLLDNIKNLYPEVFLCVKKLGLMIEQQYGFSVPESEIGYLAMHFGAALERLERKKKDRLNLKVAVVCASGLGTSSLLHSRLLKHFPNLTIVGQFSKEEMLSHQPYLNALDLVVSTISLDALLHKVPVVCVNPLLFENDMMAINQVIKLIGNTEERPQNRLDLNKVSVESLHATTEAILEIQKHFKVVVLDQATSVKMLIKHICGTLILSPLQRTKLVNELLEREAKGSTLLKGQGTILIHTRSNAINQATLHLWQIQKGMANESGQDIKLAIVMLLPKECSKSMVDAMSFFSKSLIEEDALLETFKGGSEPEIRNRFNLVMDAFLNRKIGTGDAYDN